MISLVGGLAQAGLWERIADNILYQQALAGGMAIALLCGLLSVFVVLKRMSFIGQGISHAAFGGVGVALLAEVYIAMHWPHVTSSADWPQQAVLLRDAVVAVFCIATALVIGMISRRGKVAEDTAIGICLVAAMALGAVLLSAVAQHGTAPSFESILFGDIYFIGRVDVIVAWSLAIAVLALVAGLFKELVFMAFDEETAAVFGVRTRLLYYGLLVALGLAIVVAMKSLGVVLASALLVLPGAAARFWSNRVGWIVVTSTVFSVAGLVGGLLLVIWRRLIMPPGAVIVLLLTGLFIVSYVVNGIRCGRSR